MVRTPEQRWEPIAKNQLAKRGVTAGTGFGTNAGLRVSGKIFAMLDSKGRFVVKVPRIRADALLARGQAVHFEPVPGRPMKEWLVVTGRRPSWLALAREAYEYVASL